MAKWKCEICGNEFDNFHAQGFDNKIYCPLCYFKKENQELKKENKQLKGKIKKLSQWDINKDTKNSRQRVANAKLLKENRQLKKRLTTYQILHRDCKVDNLKNISKIEEKETQQKEFIKYLEKRYKDITGVIGSYGSNTDMLYGKKDMIKEILQKYKEIIGDDKE